jgi:hypothetical protein
MRPSVEGNGDDREDKGMKHRTLACWDKVPVEGPNQQMNQARLASTNGVRLRQATATARSRDRRLPREGIYCGHE